MHIYPVDYLHLLSHVSLPLPPHLHHFLINRWEKIGKIGCFSVPLWANQWDLSSGIENRQRFDSSWVVSSSPGLTQLTWMPATGLVFNGLSTLTLKKAFGALCLVSSGKLLIYSPWHFNSASVFCFVFSKIWSSGTEWTIYILKCKTLWIHLT